MISVGSLTLFLSEKTMKFFISILFLSLVSLPIMAEVPGPFVKEYADDPICLIKTSMGDIYVELFIQEAPETVANFLNLAEGKKEYTNTKGEKVTGNFYDNLIFHRVIKNFMIQGGCPLGNGTSGPGYKFADEINANALGLDKIKAFDPEKGPHPFLLIQTERDFYVVMLIPLFQKMGIKSQQDLEARQVEVQKALMDLTIKDCYANLGYKYSETLKSHPPKRGCLAMANSGPNTNGSQFFITVEDADWLQGKHTVFGKVLQGMDIVDQIATVKADRTSRPVQDVKIISIRKYVEVNPEQPK